MNQNKDEHEALRQILRQAYKEKEKVEVGDEWQEQVMRRIRELGEIEASPSSLVMFEQLVWRLVPVTCLLILGLTLLLSSFDFISGYDVIQLLMNSTEEITLNQFFGL
ncbi:MAG: hypothetical protein PVH35_03120 [Syntrophobacterales bacterium]|jgi:hypothetical protein